MFDYLWGQALSLASVPVDKPVLLGVLAVLWHEVLRRFDGFYLSDGVVVVTICWATDYTLGSLRASYYTFTRGPEEKRWQPGRSAKGIGRWVLWMVALAIAHLLKTSSYPNFFGAFAMCLTVAMMLTEASSVFKKVGQMTGARWMEKAAEAGEDGVEMLGEQAAAAVTTLGSLAHRNPTEAAPQKDEEE